MPLGTLEKRVRSGEVVDSAISILAFKIRELLFFLGTIFGIVHMPCAEINGFLDT